MEVAAVGVNHAELERDDIGRSCGIGAYGRVVLGCGCSGRGAAGAAACEQAGDHGNAKNDCCEFFHFFLLLLLKYIFLAEYGIIPPLLQLSLI